MMEDQLYREALLERYSNPVNQGTLANADFEATLLNPLCGDEIKLQLKVEGEKLKVVEKAVFSGNGCALSQVSASLVAEFVEGKNIEQVRRFDSEELIKLLGVNPTPARLKCVLLSLEVLKKALQAL